MKKVMIFDDNEDILSICTYILEEDGWEVTAYTDCKALTERIALNTPEVILMDNALPDTGGVAATQQIKSHSDFKNIPVVYFSANSDIQLLAELAGAEYYLAKPFDLDELKDMVTLAAKK